MLQDSLISRTKILLGVNCCGTFDTWITPFMNDAVLRPYVAATSHSYQNPDWGLTSWNKYPGVDFWETESGFGGNPPGDGTKQDWSTSASEEWKEVAQFMNNRCAIFTVWNMVNDSANRSGWGWRQYVMITVDQTTTPPKVVYSPYYWAYKHFGYYVKAGAKGIKLTSTGSNPNPTYVSAFRNPNGDIIVCAANLSSTVYPTNVKVGDMYYPVTFPANSFTTVKVVVPTGVQPASLQKSVQQALSKVRLANSTLYFTTSALSGAREMRVVLTDLAGRVIWSGTRAGSALQAGQQAFAVRSSQGGLRSGAYLLSVKVKNAAGVVTNYENKVMSVN